MITRCKNGHWYDSGVNRACPHCKQESEKLSIRLNDIEEDDRTVSIIETDLSLGEELGAIIGNSIEHTMSVSQGNSFDDDDKTISFGFFGMTAIKPVAGWLVISVSLSMLVSMCAYMHACMCMQEKILLGGVLLWM